VIETLDVSLLVMVTTCDLVAPTLTLPKASLEGLRASDPEPDPASEIVGFPFEASLLMESVALNFAAAFGVNEMLRVVLAPAASDTGSVGEVIAKYLVETEALLMLTVLLPELVAVTLRFLLVPGVTSPKSRLALPRAKFPDCWPPELDWLNPRQPTRTARADRTRTALAAFPIRTTGGFLPGFFRITFTSCIPPSQERLMRGDSLASACNVGQRSE